jgi:hypothetical protein
MAHEILVIVLGWVVARIPRVRAWFARNQVAEAVALSSLLSILISATCLLIYDRYFATPDFYVKAIPSNIQHTEMSCNDGDSLVSAACTNVNGAQAAVGPKFFERDGVRWASCDRYGGVQQNAEGQLICMKAHRL